MNTPIPKISIVTPSLNQAQFLEETINSVLAQGYPNLEYIVIDGGSMDGSVDIIRNYEAFLSYWVSESDKGQTNAINKGLRQLSGDLWAYICSDDVYERGAFSRVLEVFRETNADVVYGNCDFVNAVGVVTRHKRPGAFNRKRLLKNNYIYQPSVFLKRCVLDEFGFFDERLHYAMDYEYWVRISQRAKFAYVDQKLSNYRLHTDSKTIASVLPMSKEVCQVKRQYGVGLAADLEYLRFKYLGVHTYRFRRWLYDKAAQ